jgi:hypothetical protein
MVRSVPGQGSVFSLQLRRPDVEAESAAPEIQDTTAKAEAPAAAALAVGAGGGPNHG